jgi:hypothetical protein
MKEWRGDAGCVNRQRDPLRPVNLSDPLDHDLLAFALLDRDSVGAANE